MQDEFAESRLPDLPNAGYATAKQRATSDLTMFWLRSVERDRKLLLEIVVAGFDQWKKIAGPIWGVNSAGRATAMTSELIGRIFEYMVQLAGPNPAQQLLILDGMQREAHITSYDKRKRTRQMLRKSTKDVLECLAKEQNAFGKKKIVV